MKSSVLQQKLKAFKHRQSFATWAIKHVQHRLIQARIKPRCSANALLLQGPIPKLRAYIAPPLKQEAERAEKQLKRHRRRSKIVRGVVLFGLYLIMQLLFFALFSRFQPLRGTSFAWITWLPVCIPLIIAFLSFVWLRPLLTCNSLVFLLIFFCCSTIVEVGSYLKPLGDPILAKEVAQRATLELLCPRDLYVIGILSKIDIRYPNRFDDLYCTLEHLKLEKLFPKSTEKAIVLTREIAIQSTITVMCEDGDFFEIFDGRTPREDARADCMTLRTNIEQEFQKIKSIGKYQIPLRDNIYFSIFMLIVFHTIQYFLMKIVIFSYQRMFHREETLQQGLMAHVTDTLASLWKRFVEILNSLFKSLILILMQQYEALARILYEKGVACRSAGGMPASTETHGLSLLSAHLSTVNVLSSDLLITGIHFRPWRQK